jgi:hypothetical protein
MLDEERRHRDMQLCHQLPLLSEKERACSFRFCMFDQLEIVINCGCYGLHDLMYLQLLIFLEEKVRRKCKV